MCSIGSMQEKAGVLRSNFRRELESQKSVRIEILERTSLVMYLLCMYVCVVHLIVCRELLCS